MAQADVSLYRSESRKQPPCLRHVAGPWGCAQIVASARAKTVLLDMQGRCFGTDGHMHEDHATALLPVADAQRLIAELTAAVVQAQPHMAPRGVVTIPIPEWESLQAAQQAIDALPDAVACAMLGGQADEWVPEEVR